MNKKAAFHAFILLWATLLIFFWTTNNQLNFFSLQLSAILLIVLIISHKIVKPTTFHLVESTVSTMTILLVTEATGGITSPLFFLNYILLFELSLLLEPVIPFVLSLALVLFYLFTPQANISPFRFIELLAFPFMTPLAYFFGKIYQKEKNQKKEIKNLSHKIEKLKEELVEEELALGK